MINIAKKPTQMDLYHQYHHSQTAITFANLITFIYIPICKFEGKELYKAHAKKEFGEDHFVQNL